MRILRSNATQTLTTRNLDQIVVILLAGTLLKILMGDASIRYTWLRAASWVLLASFATAIGLYSLRYGLSKVPNTPLPNFIARPHWLIAHALCASIALILGPWQFIGRLHRRWPILHRFAGGIYVVAVLVAWVCSVPVAMDAYTGEVASIGFLALGAFWIVATLNAVKFLMRREFSEHKHWMIRSYALTSSAITLRVYLGFAFGLHLPRELSYSSIAWLCWVPNLLATEAFFLYRERQLRNYVARARSRINKV